MREPAIHSDYYSALHFMGRNDGMAGRGVVVCKCVRTVHFIKNYHTMFPFEAWVTMLVGHFSCIEMSMCESICITIWHREEGRGLHTFRVLASYLQRTHCMDIDCDRSK